MNGALRHTMAAITSAVLAIQVAISIPGAPLSALVLSFMVYGFAGWLWESTVCAMLNHGSFSNSGFLLGPCCPIYGAGALVCWFALRGIENVPVQFLAAGALCCCIEYLVGVILEVTTHARFWDYSDMPLNFQGRICLYGFLMFGAGCVLICRVAEPALLGMLASMPVWAVRALALAALTLLAVDAAASMASFRRLSDSRSCAASLPTASTIRSKTLPIRWSSVFRRQPSILRKRRMCVAVPSMVGCSRFPTR